MKNNNSETKVKLKKEMSKIRRLWDTYFLMHSSLNKKTWVPKNTQFKYVGTILGNFIDTFDVIYDYQISKNSVRNYAINMSLMQAIYIQQDIMEELLLIFRTNIHKGDLKKDLNYSINRNLRNELMGHPIRREGTILNSTTLYAYNGKSGSINYMRHHKDNDFQFEMVQFDVQEIIDRHSSFVFAHFQKIVSKMKRLMKPFIEKLKQINQVVYHLDFEDLLNFTDQNFESIYREDFGYDYIRDVHKLVSLHPRYFKLIELFRHDVRKSISGHLENLNEIFYPVSSSKEAIESSICIETFEGNISIDIEGDPAYFQNEDINEYEFAVNKLVDNRDLFPVSYNVLMKFFADDELVKEELLHMSNNLTNDLEYYCSYRLIRNYLNLDNCY